MGGDPPKKDAESSGSNSNSESENSNSCSYSSSGSEWDCKSKNEKNKNFSVTSSETGLKLKIAAIPNKSSPGKDKNKSSQSSSSSCSDCSESSSSDDDLPLKCVTKKKVKRSSPKKNSITRSDQAKCQSDSEADEKPLSVVREKTRAAHSYKPKQEDKSPAVKSPQKRRGRKGKFAVSTSSPVSEAGVNDHDSFTSSSSSTTTSSSSSSPSSSDTDNGEGATVATDDNGAAALAAVCSLQPLQLFNDDDLAALLPDQTATSGNSQTNNLTYNTFSAVASSITRDGTKSSVDNNGDSSSEMELPPQLVTAAIQRATADSSSSDNECSHAENNQQPAPHYASSLLQQFVAQTQLINHSTIPPSAIENSTDSVGISDCVLGQINTITEISPCFLTDQNQNDDINQFNKELEEIASGISNPPSLDDCVSSNDFLNMELPHSSSLISKNVVKQSPASVSTNDNTLVQADSRLDTISTNSIESCDSKSAVFEVKRKRGRPKKIVNPVALNVAASSRRNPIINAVRGDADPPNVSPDSGILSNHNSPVHSPVRHVSRRRISPAKENPRDKRTKSRGRSKARQLSDSSDSEYRKKAVENKVKHIKTETSSPVPPKDIPKPEKVKKPDRKLDIAALDRMLYATDRVLYPPRRRVAKAPVKTIKKPYGKPRVVSDNSGESDNNRTAHSVLSEVYAKRKDVNHKLSSLQKRKGGKNINSNAWRDNKSENECPIDDNLDPTWREIDLNPKYKDILSGYKSDHEVKPYKSCSRLIESGYKSDYGCRSGYKSDYSRSGYKTDTKSGYKTDKSGYKTDTSMRSTMRRRMRKLKKSRSVRDKTYFRNQRHFVTDQEILLLANKTFSCLNLGRNTSDSDSEGCPQTSCPSPKFKSACTKFGNMIPKFSSNMKSKLQKKITNPFDPFSPAPVFRDFNVRQKSKLSSFHSKTQGKSLYFNQSESSQRPSLAGMSGLTKNVSSTKSVFSHKFGCSPLLTKNSLSLKSNSSSKPVQASPKSRKKNHDHSSQNKTDTPLKSNGNIFGKVKHTYLPNKTLSRNVFLNLKKPVSKPVLSAKKRKIPVVLAPPKINFKPTERLSRSTSTFESKHHRHRSHKRHRSRSKSRCRDTKKNKSTEPVSMEEVDQLISQFIKLCTLISKPSSLQVSKSVVDKTPIETIVKEKPKRKEKANTKKRKTAEQEAPTPTSKRRHKKTQNESQSKGGKDKESKTNEHKLPLKKRHYHINPSTNTALSLSLVGRDSKKDSSQENTYLCTESDCLGNNTTPEVSPKLKASTQEKSKKNDAVKPANDNEPAEKSIISDDVMKSLKTRMTSMHTVESLTVQIDQAIEECISKFTTPKSQQRTENHDLNIQKPNSEQSELSKKIYETSEKLKAVHKMMNEFEKSLPKSKENEPSGHSKVDEPVTQIPNVNTRSSTPVVTPKKRHRLVAEKMGSSSLDQVVQTLTKKLAEEKQNHSCVVQSPKHHDASLKTNRSEANQSGSETKSEHSKVPSKLSLPALQKSEIMTRKKNRLEGLTSNLVSKINPSAKTLDNILNDNIRKSIESRILEKEKSLSESLQKSTDEKAKLKDHPNTRATVIKSPSVKTKQTSENKKTLKDNDQKTTPQLVVSVDKPTGIFEPSVDLELHIPKSSISLNTCVGDKEDGSKSKHKLRSSDNKQKGKASDDSDTLLMLTEPVEPKVRPRRSESIASKISDKLQESVVTPVLRHSKRFASESELSEQNERKKKKPDDSIMKDNKANLSNRNIPKDNTSKTTSAKVETTTSDDASLKKRIKRRKTNRTGFPSVKKKKKKLTVAHHDGLVVALDPKEIETAFERVPKVGEATKVFVERTSKKPCELKVVLNKEECPKQGRVSVISLERLQGKDIAENNNIVVKKKSDRKVKEKSDTSETASIASGNDPEDSIPLSLLNKNKQKGKLKRKCREISPCSEIENIMSKKKPAGIVVQEKSRSKSSMAVMCPAERRATRNTDQTKTPEPSRIVTRRKSRAVEPAVQNSRVSSPDSSLDTFSSRETSVETERREHCFENDPLPLNEKEIDFEKSIDVLSRNVIHKRPLASRDCSPASSVDRGSEVNIGISKKNPRLRKKFLVAGLFSEYYKVDDPRTLDKKSQQLPTPLLAPPPYCEKWVRARKKHFQLPFDIWWQHTHSQSVPSWNYKKIRTNVYYDVKPSVEECESVACNCTPASGCQEECINRMVYAECSPNLCPCSDKCKNQRIQRHEWASDIEKFMTESKGYGIRTKQMIKQGDFILEYVGEVVSDKEFKERMASRYARDIHHYCLHLDGARVIDGHRMGSQGRFVNHSCAPNCEIQKWTANGTFRMALFALRDIEPGEELTYDYNFSLFNPAEGQPCKCDSENCRGVIGGKYQKITKVQQSKTAPKSTISPRGRPRKAIKSNKNSCKEIVRELSRLWKDPPFKPLTTKEKGIVSDRHCFLFRNLERVKTQKERAQSSVPETVNPTKSLQSEILSRHCRSTRTNSHTENKFANVIREMYKAVVDAKDEKNDPICPQLLKRKPEKSRNCTYCPPLSAPMATDLYTLANNVEMGKYTSLGQFDCDFNAVLAYMIKDYASNVEEGKVALQMRKLYANVKVEYAERLSQMLGPEESLPPGFSEKVKQEEVICCACGLHCEEGLMVACNECSVWQHAKCVNAQSAANDKNKPHYCQACKPRHIDPEIPLDEYSEEGNQFYLSLMRGNLQLRVGDTVYVLRDITIDEKRPDVTKKEGKHKESNEVRKHSYKTIGEISVQELDIFKIERLWKDKVTGARFVYGHHYLRPHETYHEPTRKFFSNEVMRVPLYEAVPIDLVMSQCWVLDLNTYCKGRPVGAQEEHVYICELRVDKSARLFARLHNKKKLTTKPYAFVHFHNRLKPQRNYAPHEVLPEYLKGSKQRCSENSKEGSKNREGVAQTSNKKKPFYGFAPLSQYDREKRRVEQRNRIDAVCSVLLAKLPQPAADLSYLLEQRRPRKKPAQELKLDYK